MFERIREIINGVREQHRERKELDRQLAEQAEKVLGSLLYDQEKEKVWEGLNIRLSTNFDYRRAVEYHPRFYHVRRFKPTNDVYRVTLENIFVPQGPFKIDFKGRNPFAANFCGMIDFIFLPEGANLREIEEDLKITNWGFELRILSGHINNKSKIMSLDFLTLQYEPVKRGKDYSLLSIDFKKEKIFRRVAELDFSLDGIKYQVFASPTRLTIFD